MDSNGKTDKKENLNGVDTQNLAFNGEKDECDESQVLLPSNNKGGLSKKSGKPRRKVQWNDKNGNKLAEILEFQPSCRLLNFMKDAGFYHVADWFSVRIQPATVVYQGKSRL